MKIFFANFSYRLGPHEIKDMFRGYGRVRKFRLIVRHHVSHGYGFLEMEDANAERAIEELNGIELYGRRVEVKAQPPRVCETTKQEDRHILCRNCCIPMVRNGEGWLCERCGLTWKAPTSQQDGIASLPCAIPGRARPGGGDSLPPAPSEKQPDECN